LIYCIVDKQKSGNNGGQSWNRTSDTGIFSPQIP